MLISFAATNHRSIRSRCELTLVAEPKPVDDSRTLLHVPGHDLAVVPVAAILGANGSGKSNVLSALTYAVKAIAHSQTRWDPTKGPPRDAFWLRSGWAPEPSVYELTFTVDDAVYEYEFTVSAEAFEHELLVVSPNGPRSRTRLFERTTTAGGRVTVTAGRRLRGPRAAAEAATRANSLFLSSAAQNNHPALTRIWQAIVEDIRDASPEDRLAREHFTQRQIFSGDRRYRQRVKSFLASADLGIEDVEVTEHPVTPEMLEVAQKLTAALRGLRSFDRIELHELTTMFSHRGDVGKLLFHEQSAGTQAWFGWTAPVLDTLDKGAVLGADELDSHLNEMLANRIIDSFQDPETNRHNAQLIFTAQNAHVISSSRLSRDQVWVTEKSSSGTTSLTPVTDYSPRRDWEVGRAYQHGRFGGLPVIDEEEFLRALTGPTN